MLNIIWCAMIILSVICALFTGNVAQTTAAMLDGAQKAVEFTFTIGGIMALWTGIMSVCEKSGLSDLFAKLLMPVTRALFDTKNKQTHRAIALNMTANILGLSNAATPLGIKAMQMLDKENTGSSQSKKGKRASDDMCMLAVINSASIQLIPSTLIAIRRSCGAVDPTDIVVPVWITSVIVFVFGIAAVKVCKK